MEVLVVALLIAVLTGMAAPRFKGAVRALRQREQAGEVADMMRYGRDLARTAGVRCRLRVDDQGECIWLERETAPRSKRFEPVADRLGQKRCGSGRFVVEGEEEGLVFAPDGRYSRAEIWLRGEGEKGYAIAMQGDLGRVEVRKRTE